MSSRRIAAKRAALTKALFDRDTEGEPARTRYTLRDPALKPVAELTVADHGICVECGGWSISGGRCLHCGKVYANRCGSLAGHRGPILKTALKALQANT